MTTETVTITRGTCGACRTTWTGEISTCPECGCSGTLTHEEVPRPSDEPLKGWTVEEVRGVEVRKLVPTTARDSLEVDDEVLVVSLVGTYIAKVTSLNPPTAETDGTLFPLFYEEGRGWCCDSAINKKSIERLKLDP